MGISVGIDLGTTNTSIATYDGKNVEVAKQVGGAMGSGSETTPSAIFIDENQAMFVGDKAYVQIASRPDDVARGWKRLLGTGVDIIFKSAEQTKSPEWCSTELLKRVYSYLPAAVRAENPSVVVTVPAAFGQVKNEATLLAASEAGLLNVKLMPEPVAACLAVMEKDRSDKTFLVYDLGGGTFDVSIASFKDGHGSIIAQGGIEANGGRDWDFAIVNRVIVPWLKDNYNLSIEDLNSPQLKNMLAMYAELGKIEFSQSYAAEPAEDLSVFIQVPTGDIKVSGRRLTDLDGKEVGLNVELKKSHLDEITNDLIESTVGACRIVAADNGIELANVDFAVFIGGPTLYSPLREKVLSALGLKELQKFIDPMTAVAKGAAIYAESLSNGEEKPKTQTAKVSADFPVEVSYDSRVSSNTAKITLTLNSLAHESVQVEIKNSAFSSGQFTLNFSKEVTVTLTESGENQFTIQVMVPGSSEPLVRTISIEKVLEIQGIPLAKSLFVEVVSRDGSGTEPEFLARVGEKLPKSGEFRVASEVELSQKTAGAIVFRLYQGEISDRVADNTFIGELKLESAELGKRDKISVGDELICGYEIDEGLGLKLSVSVPSIGQKFEGLYVPGEAIKNPTEDWEEFAESARNLKRALERYVQKNPNKTLEAHIGRIETAIEIIESSLVDEEVQSAAEQVRQIKRDFFEARQGDLPKRLLAKYRNTVDYFESGDSGMVNASATNSERKRFMQHAALAEAAARAGDEAEWDREDDEMWDVIRDVIWRSPWWIESELQEALGRGTESERSQAAEGISHLKNGRVEQAAQTLHKIMSARRESKGPNTHGVNVKRL